MNPLQVENSHETSSLIFFEDEGNNMKMSSVAIFVCGEGLTPQLLFAAEGGRILFVHVCPSFSLSFRTRVRPPGAISM